MNLCGVHGIICRPMNSESTKQNYTLFILLAVVMLLLGVAAAGWFFSNKHSEPELPKDLAATFLPKGRLIQGLHLMDHNQAAFTEARFKDHWSFLFFGFTNCPDVCPTTMVVMKSVWQSMSAKDRQAPTPQLFFISVDPDRDKPEKLKMYATFYHPEFVGVTGSNDQIDVLTRQVSVLYGYEDDEVNGGYTVNHSAQIVLIDPSGKMRAVFSPPHVPQDILRTFEKIRALYE